MAAFIEKQEGTTELKRIKDVFTFNEVPSRVFQEPYKYFLYTSFHFFLSKNFFDKVLKKLYPLDNIRFASLDPLPTYHYSSFGEYSIIKLGPLDSFESFISLLDKVPKGGNIADTLLNNSISVCFYPAIENGFAIYAHKDHDIAVVAFNDIDLKGEFTSLINSTFMFDRKAALEIMSMGFENQVLPQDFKESFEMNYPLS